MVALIFEVLFGFVFEVILETLVEIFAEIGFDRAEKAARSPTLGPLFRVVIYILLGIVAGIIGYFILPVHLLQNNVVRAVGSILSIVAAGLMLCVVSWFVVRKDRFEPFWSTEKFVQGIVFGAAYSVTRAFFVG